MEMTRRHDHLPQADQANSNPTALGLAHNLHALPTRPLPPFFLTVYAPWLGDMGIIPKRPLS